MSIFFLNQHYGIIISSANVCFSGEQCGLSASCFLLEECKEKFEQVFLAFLKYQIIPAYKLINQSWILIENKRHFHKKF